MNLLARAVGFAFWLSLLLMAGCASSHVMIGNARPAIKPEEVKLYVTPPPKYEEIALVDAASHSSWAIGDQGKTDVVIRRMKEEAAKLGANGILIQGVGSQAAGSVGVGNAYSTGSNSAFGTGISGTVFMKSGRGLAIYVPPGAER
ncbi:MAG: hypothetical protein AABM64_10570 [Pseudomonadota bacterium]